MSSTPDQEQECSRDASAAAYRERGWPAGVHRVTGTLLLPPSVTRHGPVRWIHPPRLHTLRWCREIDVCAAVNTAVREDPPLCAVDA